MCKNFYVKVNGLGEDGKEQLMAAGLKADSILVVDEEHRNKPIFDAIYKACGVTREEIISNDRRRNQVIARVLYVHYALMNGDSEQTLCEELSKHRTSIALYYQNYRDNMIGDSVFLAAAKRVDETLANDPKWCPPVREKPKPAKNNGKRKTKNKRKAKKKKKIVLTQEEIEAILERRQLKIDWNNGRT